MSGFFLAPTATKIPAEARGQVLLTGSHGGAYVGYLAARAGLRALVANDAGIGKDEAGIGSLALCEEAGMAAAAVSHETGRIGDAAHMLANGRISRVNAVAAAAGCEPGQGCEEALGHLTGAPLPAGQPAEYAEARHITGTNRHGVELVCIDSISLVVPEDDRRIVLSGSHGAVVAGQEHLAIRALAVAAFCNDAGFGFENAGVTRLAALQGMGVPAATVAAASARIGDGRSTFNDGVLSAVNDLAAAHGLKPGMPAKQAVEHFEQSTR